MHNVQSLFFLIITILSLATNASVLFPSTEHIWQRRVWLDSKTFETIPCKQEIELLPLFVKLPEDNEFVLIQRFDWLDFEAAEVTIQVPENAPMFDVYIFAKDRDHLWRQVRFPGKKRNTNTCTFQVPLKGKEAETRWQTYGHNRPWHSRIRRQLIEFGFIIRPRPGESPEYSGTFHLKSVRLIEPSADREKINITDLSYSPSTHVGQVNEISFRLQADPEDPYDPEKTSIKALITRPDKSKDTISGFYHEGFIFKETTSHKEIELIPDGMPSFKLRYTPRISGVHKIAITVTIDGRTRTVPQFQFTSTYGYPGYEGFIEVDPRDRRLFRYTTGNTFNGAGVNLRSPHDTRYIAHFPYSHWKDEGLAVYRRLFPEYRKAGINVVEVWMSSWWLALEWINDAPGNHGIGDYNQYRAFKLDCILDWADANNIYVILVMNNHGKFGNLYDTEWDRNPYNIENGGYLHSPEEYFSDPQAKADNRKLIDYITARWAAYDNILCWKLFTEIDLTGESFEFHKDPVMSRWHAETADYFKSRDIYNHPITTHWMLSYKNINDETGKLDNLDFLTTDAYYMNNKRNGPTQLMELLKGSAEMSREKDKPLYITEFGGSPYAASQGSLQKELHLAIWASFFLKMPAAASFWWYGYVDEADLYEEYRHLARYTKDTNRRGMEDFSFRLPGSPITVFGLKDADQVYLWAFDEGYYFKNNENTSPKQRENLTIKLSDLAPGTWSVEIHSTENMPPFNHINITVDDTGTAELTLQQFRGDATLKMKLRD